MNPYVIPKLILKRFLETIKNLVIAAVLALTLIIVINFTSNWLGCFLLYCAGLIALTMFTFPFITYWKLKSRISINRKAVVVTGCDSGFGNMFALKLDNLGFQVFAGCLFPEGPGAKDLKKAASSQLHVIKMDVRKDDDVQNALAYVKSNLGSNELWAVICNAGILKLGEVTWSRTDDFKEVFKVNTIGVTRVVKIFLAELCKSRGRLVVVASAGGRCSVGGMVPYCMSKSALISYCDGLRLEMYKNGVDVITVEPYMFKTPLSQEDNIRRIVLNAWYSASEEHKKTFPADYIENYIKRFLFSFQIVKSDKITEVVDNMAEAVTAKTPSYVYTPGNTAVRIVMWLYPYLPKYVVDIMPVLLDKSLYLLLQ